MAYILNYIILESHSQSLPLSFYHPSPSLYPQQYPPDQAYRLSGHQPPAHIPAEPLPYPVEYPAYPTTAPIPMQAHPPPNQSVPQPDAGSDNVNYAGY